MKDDAKTKRQLIDELNELRKSAVDVQSSTEELRQLKASNEMFIKAFLQSSIPLGLTTIKEGRFVDVSDAFLLLMGRNRDEVIGNTSRSIGFITEEQRSIFIRELNLNGRVENLEMQVKTKDGEVRDGLFNAVMMTLNNEKYLLTVMTDITERMQADVALAKSEEKFRLITENIVDCVALVDSSGTYQYVTPSYKETLGYDPEDMIGNKGFIYTHPDDLERVLNICMESIEQSRREVRYETRLRHKDGRYVPMDLRARSLKDQQGKIVGGVLAARDITERKRAEEALKKSEERLLLITNNSKDVIWMLNMDLQFIFISPAIEQMTGYSQEEYVKKHHEGILLPDSLAHLLDAFTEELAIESSSESRRDPNESRTFETEQITKDGARIWVEMKITFMRDLEGKPVGILGFSRDITERKRMEEELLKTKKLESVGILAGGIAHDFNNLLAAIHGYIEMAKMDLPPGSRTHDYLLAAGQSAGQAVELTKRLITFSKGGGPVRSICDIGELVKDAVQRALVAIPVEKKINMANVLWEAEVDEGQIRQVIRNLTVNAVEAMPAGGLLTVSAENVTVSFPDQLPVSEGPYVRIAIADTGEGISAEDFPLIFDPYFSTKQKGTQKGMGLGLSVCHSIVGKHAGCITVDSKPGQGSIFYVYLPAVIGEKSSDKTPRQEIMADFQKRILVMDDEARVRDMIGQLLQVLGYQVTTAEDGLQAVDLYLKAKAADQAYDMVILDLTIKGGIGGVQTLKRLREIDPQVKAIIFSGYTDDPVMENYNQYGFLGALTKPFRREELQVILKKNL